MFFFFFLPRKIPNRLLVRMAVVVIMNKICPEISKVLDSLYTSAPFPEMIFWGERADVHRLACNRLSRRGSGEEKAGRKWREEIGSLHSPFGHFTSNQFLLGPALQPEPVHRLYIGYIQASIVHVNALLVTNNHAPGFQSMDNVVRVTVS